MTTPYDTAFANVSAFVLLDRAGVKVGTIAIKRGNAVTAYVHLLGTPCARGRACGGGYDRESAAIQTAIDRIAATDPSDTSPWADDYRANRLAMRAAVPAMDAGDWRRELERHGLTVLQAV